MLRVISQYGRAGATFQLAASDTAQSLSASVLANNGANLCAMLITVITKDVKVAFGGSVPVQGGAGVGLGHVLAVGGPYYIVGETACSKFQYINSVNANNGVLMVTPFYAG